MNGLTLNDIAYRVAKHGRITRDEPRQEELDAIVAEIRILTSREAKGAASYADDPTFPADDRAMLLLLNREFETTASVCGCCGREEDARTMDAASMLRDYLAAHPAAQEAAKPVGEVIDVEAGRELVKRLRDTPNWQKESWGDWKAMTTTCDRAPKDAADYIEALIAATQDGGE